MELLAVVAATGMTPGLLARKPPPLSPADGGFTRDSVQRRLPLILESVLANNDYDAALAGEITALAAEIAQGAPLRPLRATQAGWPEALAPSLKAGETWLTAPWWLSENAFYKYLLELTDPATGKRDPFRKQKADSLAAAAANFGAMTSAGLPDCAELRPLVATSLWGNVADLSLSGGGALSLGTASQAGASVPPARVRPRTAGEALVTPVAASGGGGGGENMLLADETERLCEALLASRGREVALILDNVGLELLGDLLLVRRRALFTWHGGHFTDGLARVRSTVCCGWCSPRASRSTSRTDPSLSPT